MIKLHSKRKGIEKAAHRFHRRKIEPYVLPTVGKADLHIHTNYSDGSQSVEEILEHVHKKTDLDVIAITDHDTIEGAVIAKRLVEENGYDFEVIVGEEVTANEGHVLGLFLDEVVPPGLSVTETIEKIKDQGGIAVAVHPFYRSKIKSRKLITANGVGPFHLMREDFDAIETINTTPTFESRNLEAAYVNSVLLFMPEFGSSDAHICAAIAKGYTLFPGKTVDDLQKAIGVQKTRAMKDSWHFIGLLRYFKFFLTHFVFCHVKGIIRSGRKNTD